MLYHCSCVTLLFTHWNCQQCYVLPNGDADLSLLAVVAPAFFTSLAYHADSVHCKRKALQYCTGAGGQYYCLLEGLAMCLCPKGLALTACSYMFCLILPHYCLAGFLWVAQCTVPRVASIVQGLLWCDCCNRQCAPQALLLLSLRMPDMCC